MGKPTAAAAARAAAKEADSAPVTIRILPMGDGKVFTGESVEAPNEDAGESRFPTFARGDRVQTTAKIAAELEARGFVEIVADDAA